MALARARRRCAVARRDADGHRGAPPAEHGHQRVVQRRRLDRLGQERVDRRRSRRSRTPTDERRISGQRRVRPDARADRLGQGDAVHARACAGRGARRRTRSPRLDPAERLARRRRLARARSPQRASCAREDARLVALSSTTRARRPASSTGPIWADGRSASSAASRTGRSGGTCCPRRRTPALSAVERAAHHLGQPPADGEPEAGAAVAARDRRVGLAERLEQAVHLVRRDADAGVADVDAELPRASEPPRSPLRAGDGQRRPRRAR